MFSETMCPSKRCMTRWLYSASWVECVTMMIVVPSSFNCVRSFITSFPCAESRFPVGSSASISLGLATIALPTATLCCCPPESCWGKWFFLCMICIRSRTWFTRFSLSPDGTPR